MWLLWLLFWCFDVSGVVNCYCFVMVCSCFEDFFGWFVVLVLLLDLRTFQVPSEGLSEDITISSGLRNWTARKTPRAAQREHRLRGRFPNLRVFAQGFVGLVADIMCLITTPILIRFKFRDGRTGFLKLSRFNNMMVLPFDDTRCASLATCTASFVAGDIRANLVSLSLALSFPSLSRLH